MGNIPRESHGRYRKRSVAKPTATVTIDETNQPTYTAHNPSVRTTSTCNTKVAKNIDNSLHSKLNEIESIIEHQKPDILCLTEIKPKNSLFPFSTPSIPGFEHYSSLLDSESTRGTRVYVKNCNQYENQTTSIYPDATWI